ncbi:cytidylyltransferase domain-containing protein [Desulfofustis glycolicus]|uniref:CMP-N-acetylneuraminic acid synthetase n=1 Tax=Desulfofustis glycolicus DSM 9705 TaxID=1121409 RepID=A0A1M5YTT5_9BACT|nr:CMP-N-acetylneuraminic acid synthetase [Desulfofustis glycolicus DSM 9705]
MNCKKITALLPMKAHSERVPNKNIRLFNGRPLFHLITETLEFCNAIDSIIIDTDSDFIAEDAQKNFSKVRILKRPKALQGDFVSMNDIIAYDLEMTKAEHYLQTHSTNPLLTAVTVETAIENYFNAIEYYDSLFSVTRLQTRLFLESGTPINHNPKELLRTQDLPPVFVENSNIFLFSKTSFKRAENNRIGLRAKMFVMDKFEAIDIDDEIDFCFAEALYRIRSIEPVKETEELSK